MEMKLVSGNNFFFYYSDKPLRSIGKIVETGSW